MRTIRRSCGSHRNQWARPAVATALLTLACGAGGSESGSATDGADDLQGAPALQRQQLGTEALLQAIHPVSDQIVWVSGHRGTYATTRDGGATWTVRQGPGGDSLQFRDVHGFDHERAVLMSSGDGTSSRIYRTDDGGDTWQLAFMMEDSRGFLDCLDFVDDRVGVAYGDSFDGVPYLLRTEDGGASWARLPSSQLPSAPEGEGGFAASGTCVRAHPSGSIWVATGAAGVARVLRSQDGGLTWSAASVPVIRGELGGLTSLDFRTDQAGIALGGNLEIMDVHTENVATTTDGGATWTLAGRLQFAGPAYGGAYVPGTRTVVAVGPGGADYSPDDGATWMSLDTLTYWAVGFASPRAGWLVGPEGRVTRVSFPGGRQSPR
jgi:photosystem II stability/assembly factor-like uncharacterized protein